MVWGKILKLLKPQLFSNFGKLAAIAKEVYQLYNYCGEDVPPRTYYVPVIGTWTTTINTARLICNFIESQH